MTACGGSRPVRNLKKNWRVKVVFRVSAVDIVWKVACGLIQKLEMQNFHGAAACGTDEHPSHDFGGTLKISADQKTKPKSKRDEGGVCFAHKLSLAL